MSHALSFTEEFFTGAQGEFYLEVADKPTNVASALYTMRVRRRSTWDEMCLFVFGKKFPTIDDVLSKIRATNTCSNLNSPVEVWIDDEGLYTVLVYDKE